MRTVRLLLGLAVLALFVASPVLAGGGPANAPKMRGIEEVPALSNPAGGSFTATISDDETEITYELRYFNVESAVTQAHLHFGQRGVNGGIMLFLCSNLGNGPAGTQACPTGGTQSNPAVVTGTIHASDVIGGAAAQGLGAGELGSVIRGIKLGVVYANVHSTEFPGGALRGELVFGSGSSAASTDLEDQ